MTTFRKKINFLINFRARTRISANYEFLLKLRSHEVPTFNRLRPKVSENWSDGLSGFFNTTRYGLQS